MVLATPYRGRAIPCGVIACSSKTIAAQQDSRNLNHFRAFEALKDLLDEKPLVLVFSMELLLGEELRDFLYAEPVSSSQPLSKKEHIPNSTHCKKTKKWKRYSGLFILLKHKWSLSPADRLAIFLAILLPPVPSHV